MTDPEHWRHKAEELVTELRDRSERMDRIIKELNSSFITAMAEEAGNG